MRWIDELHFQYLFAGARILRDLLRHEGQTVGRRHVATLMRRMGSAALSRKPSLSRRHSQAIRFTSISYVTSPSRGSIRCGRLRSPTSPLRRGFLYLFAVLDWASRRVLAWRLSNTLTTDFCLDAVRKTITQYGCPEIFNPDQGCQFTSQAFTGLLTHHGIQISMDGKGYWWDNVFVERFRKSIKYEEVYLRAYDTVCAAQQGLARYLTVYNETWLH